MADKYPDADLDSSNNFSKDTLDDIKVSHTTSIIDFKLIFPRSVFEIININKTSVQPTVQKKYLFACDGLSKFHHNLSVYFQMLIRSTRNSQ